jgi:hypothetical protein
LSVARSTVALTLERVAAAGLRWPLPTPLTDRVLEAMLYAGHGSQQADFIPESVADFDRNTHYSQGGGSFDRRSLSVDWCCSAPHAGSRCARAEQRQTRPRRRPYRLPA